MGPPPQSSMPYGHGYVPSPSSAGPPGYHQAAAGNYPALGIPQSPQMNQQSFTPFPYQAPPPYISSGAYPNVQPPAPMPPTHQAAALPYQQQMSKSQPQLYGSLFSLNSNISTYGEPYPPHPSQQPYSKSSNTSLYKSPSQIQTPAAADYDYGLPPAPQMSQNKNNPPRRLSFSSPSSSSSSSSVNSPGRMIPPPYRPPPPAPSYLTSPSPALAPSSGIRSGLPTFRSPAPNSGLNQHHGSSPRIEPFPAFPYQRSLSGSYLFLFCYFVCGTGMGYKTGRIFCLIALVAFNF